MRGWPCLTPSDLGSAGFELIRADLVRVYRIQADLDLVRVLSGLWIWAISVAFWRCNPPIVHRLKFGLWRWFSTDCGGFLSPVCGGGFPPFAVAFGVRFVVVDFCCLPWRLASGLWGWVPALCRGVLVLKAAFLMFPDGAKELPNLTAVNRKF